MLLNVFNKTLTKKATTFINQNLRTQNMKNPLHDEGKRKIIK